MSVTFDVTPIFDCEGPWLRRSISTACNQFTWEKFRSVLAYRGVAQNLMEWPICDIYVPAFLYVGTRRCWCWGSNSLGHCLEWMLLSTQLNRLCYFLGVWHHVSLVLALRLGTSPWLLHFVLCLVWTIWHQWGSPRGVYPLPGLTGRGFLGFFYTAMEGSCPERMDVSSALLAAGRQSVKTARFCGSCLADG